MKIRWSLVAVPTAVLVTLGVAMLTLAGCNKKSSDGDGGGGPSFPFKDGNMWFYAQVGYKDSGQVDTVRCGSKVEIGGQETWTFTCNSLAGEDFTVVWLGEDDNGVKAYKLYSDNTGIQGEIAPQTPLVLWRKSMSAGQTWTDSITFQLPDVKRCGGHVTISSQATLVNSALVVAQESLFINGTAYPGCYKLRVISRFRHNGDATWYWYYWVKPDIGPVRLMVDEDPDTTWADRWELLGRNF